MTNSSSNNKGSQLSHSLMKVVLIGSLFVASTLCAKGAPMPPNWWELSLAEPIDSSQQYLDLVNGPYKDKFIFIDFYMEYCPWCYYILDDFNRLITDLTAMYGKDKVAFVKIDGNGLRRLSDMYKVPSYPYFVGVIPNTQGKTYSAFKAPSRNYDTLKAWMLEIMGDTQVQQQIKPQQAYQSEAVSTPYAANTNEQPQQQAAQAQQQIEIPQVRSYAQQSQQQITRNNYDQGQQQKQNQNTDINQLREQINSIITQNAENTNKAHQAMHTQIEGIAKLSQEQTKKFEELYTVLKQAISEDENKIDKLQGMQLSPATYVLLGVVGGSIAAVVLVTYIAKSSKMGHKKRRQQSRAGGPSSGSPLTRDDDEEKLM